MTSVMSRPVGCRVMPQPTGCVSLCTSLFTLPSACVHLFACSRCKNGPPQSSQRSCFRPATCSTGSRRRSHQHHRRRHQQGIQADLFLCSERSLCLQAPAGKLCRHEPEGMSLHGPDAASRLGHRTRNSTASSHCVITYRCCITCSMLLDCAQVPDGKPTLNILG